MHYINIGCGRLVRSDKIVGIFDFDGFPVPTRKLGDFMIKAEQQKRTEWLGEDLPRSFVVTQEGNHDRIYYSPVSSKTLAARMENPEY